MSTPNQMANEILIYREKLAEQCFLSSYELVGKLNKSTIGTFKFLAIYIGACFWMAVQCFINPATQLIGVALGCLVFYLIVLAIILCNKGMGAMIQAPPGNTPENTKVYTEDGYSIDEAILDHLNIIQKAIDDNYKYNEIRAKVNSKIRQLLTYSPAVFLVVLSVIYIIRAVI